MYLHQTMQNIFDQAKSQHHKIEFLSDIRTGKEAIVYKILLDNQITAMKLYKNPEERSFKNNALYLAGKYLKKESQRRALAKKNKYAQKLSHDNWIKREFFMLNKLYKLGAQIPKPILHIDKAIFMEFLGDESGAAPRMHDIELTKVEAQTAFNQLIQTVKIFWDFGIVHADLSAFNILWWNNKAYIIDFPQAIDRRNNPNSEEILNRDLTNLIKYFNRYLTIDLNEIKKSYLIDFPITN